MKKRIPYTISNFGDIRTQGYYYVDKTMYLPRLEAYRHPVFLRPRRFGKSLFTGMMRCYYDLQYPPKFDQLSGDLWIRKNPAPNHNTYFFLALNFSGMGGCVKEAEDAPRKTFQRHCRMFLRQ